MSFRSAFEHYGSVSLIMQKSHQHMLINPVTANAPATSTARPNSMSLLVCAVTVPL